MTYEELVEIIRANSLDRKEFRTLFAGYLMEALADRARKEKPVTGKWLEELLDTWTEQKDTAATQLVQVIKNSKQ